MLVQESLNLYAVDCLLLNAIDSPKSWLQFVEC